LDTIKKVLILYSKNPNCIVGNFLGLTYDRKGQDVRYALNDDKLRALGWKPEIDFDTELEHIVEYYRDKYIW